MQNKTIQIKLEKGLEASPIALLVQEASRYESKIYLESGTKKVNAKSIMGMMSLGLDNGEEVSISVEGSDEVEALAAIEKFLSVNE